MILELSAHNKIFFSQRYYFVCLLHTKYVIKSCCEYGVIAKYYLLLLSSERKSNISISKDEAIIVLSVFVCTNMYLESSLFVGGDV